MAHTTCICTRYPCLATFCHFVPSVEILVRIYTSWVSGISRPFADKETSRAMQIVSLQNQSLISEINVTETIPFPENSEKIYHKTAAHPFYTDTGVRLRACDFRQRHRHQCTGAVQLVACLRHVSSSGKTCTRFKTPQSTVVVSRVCEVSYASVTVVYSATWPGLSVLAENLQKSSRIPLQRPLLPGSATTAYSHIGLEVFCLSTICCLVL